MALKLYELAGKNTDIRFSPFVWRTRFALAHKGLDFEGIAWQFIDKQAISPTGQGKVPVLLDENHPEGTKWVHDSWQIAQYLDAQYPERPRLIPKGMGGAIEALSLMVDQWLHVVLRPLVIMPVIAQLDTENLDYFRTTREKMLGVSLEAYCKDQDVKLLNLQKALHNLTPLFGTRKYLGGDNPNYADHILMGSLMWLFVLYPYEYLDEVDALYDWRETMLDHYNGMGRKASRAS